MNRLPGDVFGRLRESYVEDIGRSNENYWFADIELLEKMVKGVKQIYRVKTWLQFFVNVLFARERFWIC